MTGDAALATAVQRLRTANAALAPAARTGGIGRDDPLAVVLDALSELVSALAALAEAVARAGTAGRDRPLAPVLGVVFALAIPGAGALGWTLGAGQARGRADAQTALDAAAVGMTTEEIARWANLMRLNPNLGAALAAGRDLAGQDGARAAAVPLWLTAPMTPSRAAVGAALGGDRR